MPTKTTAARNKNESEAIDWRAVKKQMEAVRLSIERSWSPTPAEVRRILKDRAKLLARESMQAAELDMHIEVVEFSLAGEVYAIESCHVREVYPLASLTWLPCTPSFVMGSVNVRGEILSVIDIKKFFDLPEHGLTDLNKVIVLQSDDMVFGILADVIHGVRTIPLVDIQASLPTLTGIREEYLRGVTAARVVILDAVKLLSDDKIVVQEQVDR